MKTISKFLAMFLFVVSSFGFASCSEDDDNGSGSTAGDFFEITIDGKSTTTIIESLGVSQSGKFSYIQSGDVEEAFFQLTTYSDMEKLASSAIGVYRFCPSGEPQNLDFDISVYNEDYDFIEAKNGTHTVTSIKRSGEEVVVEGKFNGVLRDNRVISGKYRLTIW